MEGAASIVNNKNSFIHLCTEFLIPTKKTYTFDCSASFKLTERFPQDELFIVKPAVDRGRIANHERYFFVVPGAKVGEVVKRIADLLGDDAPFQVQHYHDFRISPVSYYNILYDISNSTQDMLGVSMQFLSLSAIHSNINSIHWGNYLLRDVEEFGDYILNANKIAQFYHKIGYRGHLGIDFGMTDTDVFFLEANGRANNASRLIDAIHNFAGNRDNRHYFLLNKNISDMIPLIDVNSTDNDLDIYKYDDSRMFISTRSNRVMSKILTDISDLSISDPPIYL